MFLFFITETLFHTRFVKGKAPYILNLRPGKGDPVNLVQEKESLAPTVQESWMPQSHSRHANKEKKMKAPVRD
jgi:hypothetical protein